MAKNNEPLVGCSIFVVLPDHDCPKDNPVVG